MQLFRFCDAEALVVVVVVVMAVVIVVTCLLGLCEGVEVVGPSAAVEECELKF